MGAVFDFGKVSKFKFLPGERWSDAVKGMVPSHTSTGRSSSRIDAEKNPQQQYTLHSVSSLVKILHPAFSLPIEAATPCL
jgi:hypothetical protein